MPLVKKFDKTEKLDKPFRLNDRNAKSFLDKILGDVSKTSATKQLIIGASSGWITGLLAMKVGKAAACALGGGIILLEIANQKGYIKINWNKVNNKIDKATNTLEESITGQGPNWVDKMERFVDRKLDKAEENIKNQQGKVKKWFSSLTGNSENGLKEIHVFIISFAAGVALGIATT